MLVTGLAVFTSLIASSSALPVLRRQASEPFVLPTPAEGPGPTFDATATRTATGVQIRNAANPSICFDVSDFRAGDFRFNLVPLALKPCDASVDGQKFDLITKGEHNNVADESRTLIVSSQQFTCVDRRGNRQDRTRPGLFACGGCAAGDGETTADQQFFFDKTANLANGIGFTNVRDSVNRGVGAGNTCLTLNADGFVSNTACAPPNFTPEQTWIIGEVGNIPAPTPEQPPQEPSQPEAPPVVEAPAPPPATTAPQPTPTGTGPEEFILPVPAEGPGPTFDATATRAATGAQIRSAANPDLCFDVSDFRAGDFRFNLVPLAAKPCDQSVAGQKFDLITKGEHNDVADESRVIIVSSQQLTCVDRRGNKNDRTRPGLFACGGRAAGEGKTSFDQQFFFDKTADLSQGIGFATVRDAQNGGVGAGNTCLTLNADGFLSNTPCAPPNLTPEQTWIVGEVGNTPAPAPVPEQPPQEAPQQETPPVVEVPTPPATTAAPGPQPAPTGAALEEFVLPVPADGPGPAFDATATRAATGAQIRSAANPDLCFDVSDFRAGDFRFNLVPLAAKPCDQSVAGQKFDLITKGEHNNVADESRVIIVSSQQLTCVDRRGNKNDRNRPGLFACGGRAAGEGETSFDQQFFFDKTADPTQGIGFATVRDAQNGGVGAGNTCMTLNADGFLSNTPCAPPNLTPEQTWIVA